MDGRVLVSGGARMILKLVPAGDFTSDLTLDLVSVQLGKRWARLEAIPATGVSLMSSAAPMAIVSLSGEASPGFHLEKLLLRGERIQAPSNSRLTFVLRQAVRLRIEGI